MRIEPWRPPPGWEKVIREVIPGLFIGTKLVPPAEYASLGVDAIVDLEPWDYAWVPPVPDGCIYLSFPIGDDDRVDPKTPRWPGSSQSWSARAETCWSTAPKG
jgi:hypothetical protein